MPKDKLFDDLEALRLGSASVTAGTTEVLTLIPVRKPSRHEFFRVHPEHALPTTVYTDKEDRDDVYLVMPEMRTVLAGDARPVMLVPTITRQGAVRIWPVSLPPED